MYVLVNVINTRPGQIGTERNARHKSTTTLPQALIPT